MDTMVQRDSSIIMEELIANKHEDSEIILSLCKELHDYASMHQDDYAEAFSLLYFSFAYIKLSKLKACIDYGRKGHALQSSHEFVDLLQLQDNILGCAFTYRGDFQSGLNYFFEGIHYATLSKDYYLLSALYSNASELYRLTNSNDYALNYANLAHDTLLKATNNANNINFDDMQFQIDLLQIHLSMGNIEKTVPILNYCHELLKDQYTYVNYATRFYIIEAQIRYRKGEQFSSIFHSIKQALSTIDTTSIIDYMSVFWSYYDAIRILYLYLVSTKGANEDFHDKVSAYCITQLNKFYDVALYLDQAYLWILYDESKIDLYELLYKITPDSSSFKEICKLQLLSAYQHYYEQCLLRDEENKKEQFERLKDTLTLYEAKKKNVLNRTRAVQLQLESEQDALTQCANRYGLQNFIQTYFDYLKEEKKTFCCCIIDIDYFKQYNDTYGHLAGDKCLQQVCNAIRTVQNDDGFLVRYGGDEFVLLYIGKTNEELQELALNILNAIRSLQLPHSASKVSNYVTVSMGLVNRIPDHFSHSNDFLHAADNALYEVKKTSRDGFQLIYDL